MNADAPPMARKSAPHHGKAITVLIFPEKPRNVLSRRSTVISKAHAISKAYVGNRLGNMRAFKMRAFKRAAP
jgi:hypothetical protein